MKRLLRVSTVAFFFALGASNAHAEKLTLLGEGAQAFWTQVNGCNQTDVSVFGVSSAAKGSGEPVAGPLLLVGINIFDNCAGTFVGVALEGPAAEFSIQALNEAQVRGTLAGQANNGMPVEVVVDVKFVGVGEHMRNTFVARNMAGSSFVQRVKNSTTVREVAATGSVRLNGLETLVGSALNGIIFRSSDTTYVRGESP